MMPVSFSAFTLLLSCITASIFCCFVVVGIFRAVWPKMKVKTTKGEMALSGKGVKFVGEGGGVCYHSNKRSCVPKKVAFCFSISL